MAKNRCNFIVVDGYLKQIYTSVWQEFQKPLIIWDCESKYTKLYEEIKEFETNPCSQYVFLQRIFNKLDCPFTYADAMAYAREHPAEFDFNTYRDDYEPGDPIISLKHQIHRKTGNKDTKTFDFITVEILLRSDLEFNDISDFIKENLHAFDERIKNMLDNNKRYTKFGVPAAFLSLYGIGTRGKDVIEFRYELKEI